MSEDSVHWGQQHQRAAWLAQIGFSASGLVGRMSNGLSGQLGRRIVLVASLILVFVPVIVVISALAERAVPMSLTLLLSFACGVFGVRLTKVWEGSDDE